ncbi:MAG: O-antigen ligase family protein, partial [Candidatus Omnitrophota bacterium]
LSLVITSALLMLILHAARTTRRGFFDVLHLWAGIPAALFCIFIGVQYFFLPALLGDPAPGDAYRQKIAAEVLKLFSYTVIFYTVLTDFKERKAMGALLRCVLVCGFLLAVLGIVQKLSGAARLYWVSGIPLSQGSFASFPNRNHFANYMNMAFFLTLGGVFGRLHLLREEMRSIKSGSLARGISFIFEKGMSFEIFALIIMAGSLFYALSRGGMVSFAAALVVFVVIISAKGLTKRGYLVLAGFLIVIAALLVWLGAPEQIAHRFARAPGATGSFAQDMLGGRKDMMLGALRMLKARPLAGVGFGAYEFIYNKMYRPDMSYCGTRYYFDYLHNDPLQLAVEVGALGCGLLALTFIVYLFQALGALAKRRDPLVIGLAAGAVAGICAMCAHSLFDFNFHIPSNAILFFVAAGVLTSIVNSQVRGREETSALRSTRVGRSGTFAVRIVAFLVTGGVIAVIIVGVINPWRAYLYSRKSDIAQKRTAARLEPKNAQYHYGLAVAYTQEAKRDTRRCREYAADAFAEIEEALRLDPWNWAFQEYREWMEKVFRPWVNGAQNRL